MLSELHFSVVGGGVIGVWDQLTVQRDGRFSCVFAVPWTFSLFVWRHVSSVCMYFCRCVAAVSKLGCCEETVMSSVGSVFLL